MGGLPFEIGALIQNVGTVKAIYDAVVEGKPLVERAMTVTGAVKEPKNLLVRFGTPVGDLLEHCGGKTAENGEVLFGGPMMGIGQYDLDSPVIKGTNCVLTREGKEWVERDCIKCGRCIDACPMRLMPTRYVQLVKAKRYSRCDEFFIDNCFECGACAYACPSKIPIVQYIKVGKAEKAALAAREGS